MSSTIKLFAVIILGLVFQALTPYAFAQSSNVSICVKGELSSNIKLCTQTNCNGSCTEVIRFGETTPTKSVPPNAQVSICSTEGFPLINFQVVTQSKSQLYIAQTPNLTPVATPAPGGCSPADE